MNLQDNFSTVYQGLLPNIGELNIPQERFANCSQCHHEDNPNSIRHHTKCCDSHPTFPSFLVGALLFHPTQEAAFGKKVVLEKINSKIGVTPLGIIPSQNYRVRHEQHRQKKIPNNQYIINNLRCPFYVNGGCGIWKHRPAYCSHYHCTSVNGLVGKQFWDNIKSLAYFVNFKLTEYASKILEIPQNWFSSTDKIPRQLPLEDEKGQINIDFYAEIWGKWKDKEIEYFQRCFEIIQNLTPPEIEEILGEEYKKQQKQLHQAATQLNESPIPSQLYFDNQHPFIQPISPFQFKIGDIIINKIELELLKQLDGQTKTYDVIRKGMVLRTKLANILPHLIENGIVQEL